MKHTWVHINASVLKEYPPFAINIRAHLPPSPLRVSFIHKAWVPGLRAKSEGWASTLVFWSTQPHCLIVTPAPAEHILHTSSGESTGPRKYQENG